jgi:hypothetical protein
MAVSHHRWPLFAAVGAVMALGFPAASHAQAAMPECRGAPASWDGCTGTRKYRDGGTYSGEWRGGRRNGRGTFTFANGDVYQGDWRDDRQTGSGTYTTRDGEKWAGRFTDGKRDGYFTITRPGGGRTVTNFRNDMVVANMPGTSAYAGGVGAGSGGSSYGGGYGSAAGAAVSGDRAGALGALLAQGSQYMNGADDQAAPSGPSGRAPRASVEPGPAPSSSRLQVASAQPVSGGVPASRPAYAPAPQQAAAPAPRQTSQQLAAAQPQSQPAPAARTTAAQPQTQPQARPQPQPAVAQAVPAARPAPAALGLPTSQRKVALIIGNGAYKHANPLPNPKNDAADMAKMLKSLGFTVVSGTDLDYAGMQKTVRTFLSQAETADVALFFYAGHGIQVSGSNYLIPVDAKVEDSAALDFELVNIDAVTGHMGGTNKVGIVLLDACRNNPFTNSLTRNQGTRAVQVSKGLAQIASPAGGLLVAFATAPGDVAADGGKARNSPFTTALLKQLPEPGLEIELIMKRVKADVISETNNSQRPWHNSDLAAEVYLTQKKG